MQNVEVARPSVHFEYEILRHGFARTTFRVGDNELKTVIGWDPDPLVELLNAALAIARGEPYACAEWDPEDGGEFHWQIRSQSGKLQIRVDYIVQSPSGRGGSGYPGVAFEANCLANDFCIAVKNRAEQLLARYTPEQFIALWIEPFPLSLLEELRAVALDS